MASVTSEYSADRTNGNTIRQELWRIEDRLARDIAETKADLVKWHDDHTEHHRDMADAHEAHLANVEDRFGAIKSWLDTRSIIEAKREGALGIMVLVMNTLGRNWAVILTIIAGALMVTNNIHITVL